MCVSGGGVDEPETVVMTAATLPLPETTTPPPESGCAVTQHTVTLRHDNCTADVIVNACAGGCSSGSALKEDGSGFESNCACCAPDPEMVEVRAVELLCGL